MFKPPVGILSNVNKGAFEDVLSQQNVYDQYGRLLEPSLLNVFRFQDISTIVLNNIVDDVTGDGVLNISGAYLYVDGYEHIIKLTNRSLERGLLFDSFLGIQINKLKVDFRTSNSKHFKPIVDGRFLFNNNLLPNFEALAGELQYMYDVHKADEDSPLTQAGRRLLGFETKDYFNQIGVTDKSQFLFYRGMIQQKGSMNAIKAFINLKLFIDANVDGYWVHLS